MVSVMKGFAGTLRHVGGSKVVTIPDWVVKAEKLEEGEEYTFFVVVK
jgi:antitoxin component of MazEF toxin-antitoxin module